MQSLVVNSCSSLRLHNFKTTATTSATTTTVTKKQHSSKNNKNNTTSVSIYNGNQNKNFPSNLLNSLLKDYRHKTTASLLYNKTNPIRTTTGLISCLFSNLRFLTLNAFINPLNSSFPPRSSTNCLLSAALLNSKSPLHLITAYSGYPSTYSNLLYKNLNHHHHHQSSRPKSKVKFGDDAWFIAKQKFVDVLGVADGVGGWHSIGYDPSKFSSHLMKTCKRLVEQEFNNLSKNNAASLNVNEQTPINILKQSYQALIESKQNRQLVGSSTACIILFHHETNLLHTANLGDSGFLVIRNNKVIHKSQDQQHYFNSPFQMGILPHYNKQVVPVNHEQQQHEDLINDSPDNASTSSIQLDEGDFIVLATDGLWDNLTEKQLLNEIANIKGFVLDDLEKAANDIAKKAIEQAFDPDYQSPFALAARQNGININGGKPDDITVLLARVSK
jgi:protein phosphatase PTC7